MTQISEIRPIKPDHKAIVVHWSADRGVWRQLTSDQWRHFLMREAPLPGLTGDHYFAVCIVDDDSRICNIIPHRYRLDQAGLITSYPFDDMSAEERIAFHTLRRRYYAYDANNPLKSGGESFTGAERKAFADFHERIRRSSLPPQDAALALLCDLPNGLTKNPDTPAHEFFRELGIETPTAPMSKPLELVEAIVARRGRADAAFDEAIEILTALERAGLVIVPHERILPTETT